MPETTEAYVFRGRTVLDREGEKVGKIDELYFEAPVPKERVRLDKDTVTEEREISEEVRKEQIESEGVDRAGRSQDR